MLLVLAGALAALLAAVLYASGVTLQAVEAREAPGEDSLSLRLLKDLVTRPRWIGGTGCVIGGWLMQGAGVGLAPLTIVQPALALSVVVLLAIGVKFFDSSVGKREAIGALGIVIGVAGLAAVSPGQTDQHAAPVTLGIGLAAIALAALLPYIVHRLKPEMGTPVALSAGFAYAFCGFTTKFLADSVSSGKFGVATLWLAGTAAAALIGLTSEMTALQCKSAIEVFPIVLVVQVIVDVLLAPVLAGGQWALTIVFVLVVVGSLAALVFGTRHLCTGHAVKTAVAGGDDDAGSSTSSVARRGLSRLRQGGRRNHPVASGSVPAKSGTAAR